MSRSALLAGLMAVGAIAQASFAIDSYEYIGCISADPAQFPVHPTFVKAFTPQQCQEACKGKANFVALGDGCHCDDPSQTSKFMPKMLTEKDCATLCIPDDVMSGYCGGGKDGSMQIYDLYRAKNTDPNDHNKPHPDNKDEDCDEEEEKEKEEVHEKVVVVEGCPPEVVDCPARKNWNGTRPDHHDKHVDCEECEKVHEVKVVCICPEGCGDLKHGEPCPPEGCPAPNDNSKVIVCLIPEGCGSIKAGEPCPPEGCPKPEDNGSSSKVIVCEVIEGCGSIKHGEACPPEGCPKPEDNGSSSKVIVCEVIEGCGSIKHGEACPAEGCPAANTKPADNGSKTSPADTGDKSKACPPEGCPEEKAADNSKPAGTPECPPEGCSKNQGGEKPVIVSGGVKLSMATVLSSVAVVALGFSLA